MRFTAAKHSGLVLSFVLFAACGVADAPVHGAHRTNTEGTRSNGDGSPERSPFVHRIDDEATWDRLAARPRNHAVARTEVVKFLIDLAHDRRLWLIDTEHWDIHYFFARDHLNDPPVEQHRDFNVRQYRRPDRRFVLGSLVHYLDSDLHTFEMIAGDDLEGDRVLEAFEQVRDAVYFGDRLRYRPTSQLHEQRTANLDGALPRVSADEVFAGIRYQPLTLGVAYGTLRFVRGPLDASTVRPDQILVLEQLPDEIPVSAGVVSQQLQAPLGHLAILCATRHTPNMALRRALDDPNLAPLEGRLVRLEIGAQEPSIREATRAEAEAAWASRRPQQSLTPLLDATDRGLVDVCTLTSADSDTVGAKAAQLGEACQIGGVIRTPGGFAVPFHHYVEHVARTGAARGVAGMLADDAFRADAQVREQRLAELRAIIERTPIERGLLRSLRLEIDAFPGEPRVILRSSTNAEDLPGFTGAGLYRSVVIGPGASDRELAEALRRVWASVWLLGAYEEREWYRIDHARVAMGVIVQPFVDGAFANGVAITANPFYEGRPGFFVNAQALGGSVTGAGGDEIPEQHIIYTYTETPESELLSRSTRNGGQPLLRETEIHELTEVLRTLHDHFVPRWADRMTATEGAELAVDVEFLIAGPDRDVVVLQARPFQVVYADGQRW